MDNKLLIYEQNYDLLSFYYIIDKNELEDYTQEWIKNFIDRHKTVKFEYKKHVIKDGTVRVQFFQHAYEVGKIKYEAQDYWDGFDYLELKHISEWKKK